jgi:preprotein translocase subunit SecG
MSLPLAAVPFYMTVVMIIWVLTCLALVFIILIQKGKGGGLSAAFGGAGGAGSLFGAKTGDALTWITIGIAGFFLFLSVIMGLSYRPVTSVTDQGMGNMQPTAQPAPEGAAPAAAPTAPAAAPTAPAAAPTAPAAVPAAPAAAPTDTSAVPAK